MRTCDEIFLEEDPASFFLSCHPVNGIKGFNKWCERVHGKQIKDFHEEWIGPIIRPKLKGMNIKVAIAAPTGFGKTELFAVMYPCYCMWYESGWEALIVSNSMPQAKKIIYRIKDEITNNEVLLELKPKKTEAWSAEEIKTVNRCNVACKPLNENVKSYHVDYIFADEIASYKDKNCYLRWVSTRIGAKKGAIAAVSTFEQEGDLLDELLDNPEYDSIRTSAEDEKGESIWPERFPTKWLRAKRIEIGDVAYCLQYLSKIGGAMDDPSRQPFPFSIIVACSDKSLRFDREAVPGAVYYIAYDPAFSITGDYHAIIVARRMPGDDKIYIAKIYRLKGDPDEVANVLKAANYIFHPVKIIVDTSSGGVMVLKNLMKFNLPCVHFPFIHENRNAGFRAAVQEFHKGTVVIPTSDECSDTKAKTDVLYKELMGIVRKKTPSGLPSYESKTKNDDVAMAFLMLMKVLTEEAPFIPYCRTGKMKDVTCPRRDPIPGGNITRFKYVVHDDN